MRAEVGGVGRCESLEIFPEGFGVLVILREMPGAAEDEGPTKAGGFPEIFDVVVRKVKRPLRYATG